MLTAAQLDHEALHGADLRAIVTAANLMRAFSLVVCLLAGAFVGAQAQSTATPARSRPAALVSIGVSGHVVVISADGPLPAPTVGVLHLPERIYLDLSGISARAVSAAGDGDLVRTVRAAQHSLDPPVARIVIDLLQPSRYEVNMSRGTSGRIEISLTPRAPQSTASTAADSVAPPPASGAARPAAVSPATRRYVSQLEVALNAASNLRNVLRDLDRRAVVSPDRIPPAQAELDRLRVIVDGLRAPADLTDAHDLVRSALGFAMTALSLASSSTGDVPANASSAAAGALMMLDRAQAEWRTGPSKKNTDQFVRRSGGW